MRVLGAVQVLASIAGVITAIIVAIVWIGVPRIIALVFLEPGFVRRQCFLDLTLDDRLDVTTEGLGQVIQLQLFLVVVVKVNLVRLAVLQLSRVVLWAKLGSLLVSLWRPGRALHRRAGLRS